MIIEPKIVKKKGVKFFLRLTLNQRAQHLLLLISFALLALTGIPMKYYDASWATPFYDILGGIKWAPIIHRIAALIIIITFFYHVGYVIAIAYVYYLRPLKEKGQFTLLNALKSILSMPMIPNALDLREAKEIIMYYFFLSSKKPVMRRFGVREKFGYWAVFWGMPILGITGFFLWAEGFVTRYLPGMVLNISYIAHSDEALLAVTVIFIWHIYNTHLNLSKFPMGLSWFTGYEKEEEMMEEHYHFYTDVMKGEGLDAEIKQEAENHFEAKKPLLTRILSKLYLISIIFILLSFTIYIVTVIYHTTFGHLAAYSELLPAKKAPTTLEKFLVEVVQQDKETEKLYRGYRITMPEELKDYYHNITLKVTPDNRSHCIKCHGDFPHGEIKQIRAFLNMHAFFLACETCHIRPKEGEKPFVYKWYNITSGDIVNTPELGNQPIDDLGLKLVPCRMEEGKIVREDSDERIIFADDFIQKVNKGILKFEEEKRILKKMHDHVDPQSIKCQDCHRKDQPFLPYEKIGYSKQRSSYLCSSEISGMIRDFKLYHTPTAFKPWEKEEQPLLNNATNTSDKDIR